MALATVLGTVPPLREATAAVLSRVVLVVAFLLAPDIRGFEELPQTTRVLATDGTVVAELTGGERRDQVRLGQVPRHVPRAVLAAEDARFYHHSGVDPTAVLRALVRRAQGDAQGGSTITQQLAKLNYTGSQRTMLRKLREVLYASRLEERYSKDQLLERYLNQVYFGGGAYGIGAAAQTYFGIPARRLTPAQAAALAAKIRAPESLDPHRRPDAVRQRRDDVLRAMAAEGWLDRATLARSLAVVPRQPEEPSRTLHVAELVRREALGLDALGGAPQARRRQLFTGGYTIHSTLDPRAFDAAVEAVRTELGQPGDPTTAVASIVPGDGAIRVLVGGIDPAQKFDAASQGERQPGSAFKPFVYLAALRDGIDPRSVLDGVSPQTFTYNDETFEVTNYEGAGGGPATIDDALVHSINTVYMRLGLQVGPPDVVRAAQDAGIDKALNPVAAVSLGGIRPGVSPLEMAAAYATFAARGTYAEPYAIARITDRRGRTVYRHEVETHAALDEREVGVLNAVLRRVITEGTGRGAALGRDVAGKTGTTSEYRDAYFVGYVPQLATAVWTGFQDNRPMTAVRGQTIVGGTFPASVFRRTMKGALAGVPARPLFTASPEQLGLHLLNTTPTTTTVPGSTRSTVTSTTSTTSTTALGGVRTLPGSPSTTVGTTAPPATTSPSPTVQPTPTTAAPAPVTTATPAPTTTAPPPPTTAAPAPTTTAAPAPTTTASP